jgi:hypothetical protein
MSEENDSMVPDLSEQLGMDQPERIDELEKTAEDMNERLQFVENNQSENPLAEIFPARMTAFTSGTGATWQERFASGTVLVDMLGGRFASAATNPCAVFGPGETDFISVEQEQPYSMSVLGVFSGLVDVYLTQVGGSSPSYTYNGYLDSGKTVKVFSGQASQGGGTDIATKGLARLVGKTWRLVQEVGVVGAGGSTSSGYSRPYQGLLFAKTWPAGGTMSETIVTSTGNVFPVKAPLSGSDAITGESINAWQEDRVLRVRASGYLTGLNSSSDYFYLFVEGEHSGFLQRVGEATFGPFMFTPSADIFWTIETVVTIPHGYTAGNYAFVSTMATAKPRYVAGGNMGAADWINQPSFDPLPSTIQIGVTPLAKRHRNAHRVHSRGFGPPGVSWFRIVRIIR